MKIWSPNLKILPPILKYLTSKTGLRLISLVGAIVIWYSIRAATGNSTWVTDIRLTLQPPPDWVVTECSAKTIDVAFLGTRDDIRYLNRELIKATLDLRTHTNTAAFTHTFTAADINAPGSSRIDFVRPSTVTLRLDREITKQVPVRVETQNLLPDGYEMEASTITPATVEVTGPEQRLQHLEVVTTQPVDLDGRIRPINKRRLGLIAGDGTPGIKIEPANVTLDIPIVERSVSTRYTDLPIEVLYPSGRPLLATLTPEIAIVTVKGRPELMKTLEASEIRLFVDATDVEGSAPARRAIRAHLPAGITLVRTEPANAKVTLTAP